METFELVALAADVKEGALLPAEVRSERILLARVDGQIYAMGRICTHEDADLTEGELDGYRVTCPLHGSLFDLRTGAVLTSPAVKAEPTYAVKVEQGKVLVSSSPWVAHEE